MPKKEVERREKVRVLGNVGKAARVKSHTQDSQILEFPV
jgi:hypothetical protein